VVKPSLPLRDAVALSKDLAAEGLKVQVRRAGSPAPAAAATPPAAAASGETLHRVRVGPFADLAAARAARAELESKGYKGFIARGGG
jgi:cell division septation protein DedD